MGSEMILCIEISVVFVPYEFSDRVVLDGGGHVHYNKCKHGKEIYPNKTCSDCKEGKRILEPQRLKIAIEKIENKGYTPKVIIGALTLRWAATNPDKLPKDGAKVLNDLLNQGKIKPVNKKKEDIWWLSYALDEQAYIFTYDKFQDKYEYEEIKKRGKVIRRKKKDEDGDYIIREKGERALYPDLNWDEIDARTFQFEFFDGNYVVPDLPARKGSDIQLSKSDLLAKLRTMENKFQDLENRYDALLAINEMKTLEHGYEDKIREIFRLELGNGSLEVKKLYQIVAREVLELPQNIRIWPDDWESTIREVLGYNESCKTITLMEDLSLLCKGEHVKFYPGEERTHVKFY